MLQRHGRLWILFALCLMLILPAMVWLTVMAVNADRDLRRDRRETELARQEAEVQEKITSALYRMDWKLGPHIAKEAARPYYMYDAFHSGGLSSIDIPVLPSPLLSKTSDFVKLHFQIDPDNIFSSPQRPMTPKQCEVAFTCCGVTPKDMDQRDLLIQQSKSLCNYDLLLARVSAPLVLNPSDLDRGVRNVYVQQQAYNYANKYNESGEEKSEKGSNAQPELRQQKGGVGSKVAEQRVRGANRGGREFVARQQFMDQNTKEWALGNAENQAFNDNRLNGYGARPKQTSNDNPFGSAGQSDVQAAAGSQLAELFPFANLNDLQVVEGVMKPVWIEDNLFLVRTIELNKQKIVQCCWLDWEKIQNALRNEVQDILTDIVFEPVLNDEMLSPDRALVTLPVQLVFDSEKLLARSKFQRFKSFDGFSGLKVALLLAWVGLILSTAAIAALLYGVLQLSERRAAFVSAVTHELRTPLTTFKMYSEMLAEKMVPEDKQVQYANTLKLQADRLSHLVENVLQFARLERGADQRTIEPMAMSSLLDGISSRLQERASQSQRELSFQIDKAVLSKRARIEPHAIEQILFNLVDNACKYGKSSSERRIEVVGRMQNDRMIELSVRDYGPGIGSANARKIFQPFSKSDLDAANSEPGVGLGLSLCRRMASSFKGRVYYENCDPGARFYLEIPAAS